MVQVNQLLLQIMVKWPFRKNSDGYSESETSQLFYFYVRSTDSTLSGILFIQKISTYQMNSASQLDQKKLVTEIGRSF